MDDLFGSDEICVAAQPLIMAASRIKPKHLNVDKGFEHSPCWVDYLIFDPLELEAERPRFFGRQHIRLLFYYRIAPFIYESGAVLGCIKKDKVNLLEKLLRIPYKTPYKNEGDITNAAQNTASIRLNEFKTRHGREPLSFYDFVCGTAEEAVIKSVTDDKKVFEKLANKVTVDKALVYLRALVLEGLGFGSMFPELTKRMFKSYYEEIDMDEWKESKENGANIPDYPKNISLEYVTDALLSKIVATLLDPYYPPPKEILQEIGLTTHIEAFKERTSDYYNRYDEWHDKYSQLYNDCF